MVYRLSPCGCIFRISKVFFSSDSSVSYSLAFLAFAIFWIFEEIELTDRLNCVASFFRTDWLKMMFEFRSCSRISVSSADHPFRLSFEPMVLELSLLISIEPEQASEEHSCGSSFLKKLRVNLELYFQI